MKMNPSPPSGRKLRPTSKSITMSSPFSSIAIASSTRPNRVGVSPFACQSIAGMAAVRVGHAGAGRIEGHPDGAVLSGRHVGLAEEGGRAVLEIEQVEGPVGAGHGDPSRRALRGVGLR